MSLPVLRLSRARVPFAPIASTSRLHSTTTSSAINPHSSISHTYAFSPVGTTSASTNIPYGDPSLASASYLPPDPSSSSAPTSTSEEVPELELTAREKEIIEKIIRVDQAGELGANTIYEGQLAVMKLRGNKPVADLIQEMWDGEKKHIAVFDKLLTEHNVRPTALYPLWRVMGLALGAGTAMLGTRAAMACTEAVETVIGEHYNSQVQSLSSPTSFPSSSHPQIQRLKSILEEFRDDELEHLDTAVKNQSQQAPAHALLSAVIAGGCKVAIEVSKRI
ncbi:ubiquinone biosynthesis monooxygenase COQ7 [Pseudohyphozyma bogoriensis]|nr:ubiquinone biosynthesis monooxygenase COQ7 [Pseudohyphozyma bogoriensis]